MSNAAAADKIRDYRSDYNNRNSNSISFMSAVASTSGRLHCEFVCILFLQTEKETAFLQFQELSMRNTTRTSSAFAALLFTPSSNLRSATSSQRPQPCVSTLTSMTPLFLHAHPSHSQTSRLLSTSLSLGTPFPHST